MHFFGCQLTIEQSQSGTHDLLYGLYDRRQNLVRHDLVRIMRQAALQGPTPGDPKFRIDMDDIDSSGNRTQEIFVVCSRTTVQREKDPNRLLDLRNSLNVQLLFSLSLDHAFQHAMHIADRRSEYVDRRVIDELSSFLRRG